MRPFQIAAFLFLCLNMSVALAQDTRWDSTYRPAMYAGKVGQFKSFRHSSQDFVFLGNSITTYTDWNELLKLSNCKNRGIPGDMTFGVLQRLDEVIAGKPAKVFILIGINDITRNVPDSVVLANYTKMVNRIKRGSPKTHIYFQSVLPVNDTYQPMRGKAHHVKAVNRMLEALADQEHITFINLYPHFLDATGVLDSKLTFDGIHLNDAGYFIWAQILIKGRYLN